MGALTAHGVDPEVAKLGTETLIQATAITALSLREKKKRNTKDIAATFATEVSAALIGKMSHGGTESLSEQLIANERATAISALLAGKVGGIATAVGAQRSGASDKVGDWFDKRAKAIGNGIRSGLDKPSKRFIDSGTDVLLAMELERRGKLA